MEDELVFRKFDGTKINDLHGYVQDWCNANPYGTVTVGCDSQEYARYIKYAVTICMHYVDENGQGHGGHVIFCSIMDRNKNMKTDVYTKLWAECELTVKAASMIGDVGKKIKVHLDYNSDDSRYSNVLYSSGIGFVNGMGFEAYGKPYSYSCHTADRIAKNKVKK
jgi:predicted RNase H-related nuclease YkuK (DUF458 family)